MSLMPAPALEHVTDLTVFVAAPIEVGDTGSGQRRVIPITGGTARGPRLNGTVLSGGADFQLVRPDHVAELDARYVIQADDGTCLFVMNRALRRASAELTARLVRGEAVDPSLVYFRCTPSFEAPAGPHRWLAENLFVAVGARRPDRVEMSIFRIA
ncbi:MAG: DUF3237 domain-containing protein [Burkholderiaceae bacterium]|jgi:hypothetical protein|nr:DUF3237 domain-containing protein [Burkholderiaceae bacterium]